MSDNNRYAAKVVWFDSKIGIGFLEWEGSKNGNDMFVHFSDLENQSGFKTLKKDQKVEFEIGKNNKGQDKAVRVVVID